MYTFILELIEDLKTTEFFRMVDIYRNEFQNADWNPQFPACLVRLESFRPAIKTTDNFSLTETGQLFIYVVNKNRESGTNALKLAEDLYNEMEKFEYASYKLTQEGIQFVETGYGVDVYQLQLTVTN